MRIELSGAVQFADKNFVHRTISKAYSKRLNILVHGLKENKLSAWEKRDDTLEIFKDFMKDGLLFDDLELDSIQTAHLHRLAQRPWLKNGKRINRPIIVKPTTISHKRSVFISLGKKSQELLRKTQKFLFSGKF